MDSRRALTVFWGMRCQGRQSGALIRSDTSWSWWVTGAPQMTKATPNPKKTQVRVGFLTAEREEKMAENIQSPTEEGCAYLTEPANGRPLYGPPI